MKPLTLELEERSYLKSFKLGTYSTSLCAQSIFEPAAAHDRAILKVMLLQGRFIGKLKSSLIFKGQVPDNPTGLAIWSPCRASRNPGQIASPS